MLSVTETSAMDVILDGIATKVENVAMLDKFFSMPPISLRTPIQEVVKQMECKQGFKHYFVNVAAWQIQWTATELTANPSIPMAPVQLHVGQVIIPNKKLGTLSYTHSLGRKEIDLCESYDVHENLAKSTRFVSFGTTSYILVHATNERVILHARAVFPEACEQRAKLQKRVSEIAHMERIVKDEFDEACAALRSLHLNEFKQSHSIQTDQIVVCGHQPAILHGNVKIEYETVGPNTGSESGISKMLLEHFPDESE